MIRPSICAASGRKRSCLSPGIESSISAADGARLPHLIICLIGKPSGADRKLRRALVGGNHNNAYASFECGGVVGIERAPLWLLDSQPCLRSLCARQGKKNRNKSDATPTFLLIKAIPMPVSGKIVCGIKSCFIFSAVKMLGHSIKASHFHTKAQKVLCLGKKVPKGRRSSARIFWQEETWQLIIVLVHSADYQKSGI